MGLALCGFFRIIGPMKDKLTAQLLDLAARFEAATSQTRATAAKRALNDNTFFARIEGGAGFNITTFDKVVLWFSQNWPEQAEWPKGVERPFAVAGGDGASSIEGRAA
jgi:hypothetical protein